MKLNLLVFSIGMIFTPTSVFAQSNEEITNAFKSQSISLRSDDVQKIRSLVDSGIKAKCSTSQNNSRVKFAAVEIASELKMDPGRDSSLLSRITTAIGSLSCNPEPCVGYPCTSRPDYIVPDPIDSYPGWDLYYDQTINLTSNSEFLRLVGARGFHPVKISWEDISRFQGSVWGDRISDVGIWVRKYESDPSSAQLALSVRRDSNYHDKVLMVPAEAIKIHIKHSSRTEEVSLPRRLHELGLASTNHDKHVIVSNQFAIVPVPRQCSHPRPLTEYRDGCELERPQHDDKPPQDEIGFARYGHPARAAFTFSIFPYGSTNYVITDVIEGSSDAIVGPGTHQLLFSNVNGMKAPFTASRAAERPDLLALEKDLKGKGMDVDVQRYYLIQIPLRKNTGRIQLSNMGTPPFVTHPVLSPVYGGVSDGAVFSGSAQPAMENKPMQKAEMETRGQGVDKVAIGHGETEGSYNQGSGFRGSREEAPIRVTVVYFVTPRGELTEDDMNSFSKAFEQWDSKAIWGGSFVEP